MYLLSDHLFAVGPEYGSVLPGPDSGIDHRIPKFPPVSAGGPYAQRPLQLGPLRSATRCFIPRQAQRFVFFRDLSTDQSPLVPTQDYLAALSIHRVVSKLGYSLPPYAHAGPGYSEMGI